MRLAAYATYVPDTRVLVEDCVTASGATRGEAKAFSRLFGISEVALTPQGTSLTDVFGQVLTKLGADWPTSALLPDTLIYVHGNPVQADTGAELLSTLCAEQAVLAAVETRFEMDQQNCSTLFWGLDAAQKLLSAGLSRSVLVMAGDCLSAMPLSERYAPGCTAIGDAFAVLVLDAQPGGIRLEDITLATRAEHHTGRFGAAAQTQAFNLQHSAFVSEILGWLGLDAESVEPILAHNINQISWSKFCKDTGTDRRRVWLDLLNGTGHCYTLDAALLLRRFFGSGDPMAAMLSVGQGGFLAGCRISKDGNHHATS